MSSAIHVAREYYGLPSPSNIRIPTPFELVQLCTAEHPQGYNMGLAYPPTAPVFWIKYGPSVIWNEVPAQVMAYEELRRLRSPVRAPGIFYACEIGDFDVGYTSYIVMKYTQGNTAGEWIKNSKDLTGEILIYHYIASAISELHRIPVPPGSRPAAVDGGKIRHALFDDQEAPRHYKNVTQLQDHLNLFLAITKRKERVQGLSREPMVFCYSDVWLDNFIIDDDGRVAVVDFADTSILLSSFSKFVLSASQTKIKRDISVLVEVPTTDGIDNTLALQAASGPMVMGPSSFVTSGRRIPGG